MQSEIILLSNVKQDNIANLVQKQFEMLGITGIKGKRIDAEEAAVHQNVAEALADYNVIMVIGGMGEKENAITAKAVASAIGFSTVEKDGEIFPEGAEILKNRNGKPSGCAISQGNQCVVMLPGDTETLQFMLCYRVAKYLAEFIGGAYSVKTLRAAGVTKSAAEEAVSLAETADTAVRVYEDNGEIAVQIYARGDDRKAAAGKVSAALKSVAARLGTSAYAVDAENVGQAFGKELSKKDLTVAMAVEGITREEAANAAYVNEFVGNYIGASQGVQKYNIPEKLLQRHGTNSTWTAAVLAGEVAKTYGSNIGIAITTNPEVPGEGANIAVCMGDNLWTEHIAGEGKEDILAAAGARAIHLARSVAFAYPKLYENATSLMGAVSGKTKFKTAKSETGSRKWYARFIPMKGDDKTDLIRKIIFLVCVATFIGSMTFLGTKVADTFKQADFEREFLGMVEGEISEEHKEAAREWGYNEKLYTLFQENHDLIAYIKIDESNVNFPVVQTYKENEKGLRGQYYLRKDFYGNKSMYGTPFLDYRCNADPEEQSFNLIVYGHNVYDDGKMFSDLIKYRRLKFYKEHPVIHFDTLYENRDWLVVGVILTNAYEKDGPVWNYNNFIDGDEAEKKEFLNQVAKRTMVVTGVDYNTSDDFLTLSTCSYDFKDARVVIIAREVREGEDITAIDTSKAYYNSNPVMPDKWYQVISEAQQSESDAAFGDAEEITGDENIEKIEFMRWPLKTEYTVGETLNTNGIILNVYRKDGTIEEVESGFEVSNTEPFTEPGEYQITVTYLGHTVTYTVIVKEAGANIVSIEIASNPTKLEYKVGEKLDLTGLSVKVNKKEGDPETITSGFTASPAAGTVFSEVGSKKVTVTYEGQSTSFTVNVKAAEEIKNLELISKPTKLEYKVGETLDLTGLKVKVTNNDDTPEEITDLSKLTIVPANGTVLDKAETKTIKVTYKDKSVTFTVEVKGDEIKGIAIYSKPTKGTYKVNEALDLTGLSITVTKNDDTTETVTTGFTTTPASGSILNTVGTIAVEVDYKGKKTSFNVEVKAEEPTSSTPPESTEPPESPDIPEEGTTPPSTEESPSTEMPPVGGTAATYGASSNGGKSPYYNKSLNDTVYISGTAMSMYDAVCQIVAFEAGQGQPDEHVKAQAVATYTYIQHHNGRVTASRSTKKLDNQIRRCVAEVIGYAVLDDRSNKPILATYFSESCGVTANAEWVWGYANRNLVSVSSSVDGTGKAYTYTISSDDFASKVYSKLGINLSGDPSNWVQIASYWGGTDYVNSVKLGNSYTTGRKLRETVLGGANLRSVAFNVSYNSRSDSFTFTSYGYGHGVGLSAKGSIKYAKQGYDWNEILMKYYSNCYIGLDY